MLSSCKIRIVVPEGGSVATQSGAYSCASGKTCNIEIVDFFFDQTFIAKPANGYTFRSWKKADRRFCGRDPKPCRLATKGLNANDVLRPVMLSFFEAADEVFYLQPVFEPVSSSSTCSVFFSGTPFCNQGTFPNCRVTFQQAQQVAWFQSYSEIVKILGCHGKLTDIQALSNQTVATYHWGGDATDNLLIIVMSDALGDEPEATAIDSSRIDSGL